MTATPLHAFTQVTPFDGGFDDTVGSSGPAHEPLLDARIMIVDDDAMMAEVVQTYLEEAGYRDFVVTADPREALDLIEAREPDVLLLDLLMPGVSGFDILTQLRARPEFRFLPVIVLTAASGGETKLQALQLGATDFLGKPIDPSELVLRVRNTLAFRQFHERSVNFDALTGLPTRKHFLKLAHEALQRRPPQPADPVVCLSIGVPGARRAAETFGQAVGDPLIALASRRVDHAVAAVLQVMQGGHASSPSALQARLRSEQFVLLINGFRGFEDVESFARQLIDELGAPLLLDNHPYLLEPVVGATMASSADAAVATLVEQADLARQQAVDGDGSVSAYAFYSAALSAQVADRRHRANELARALERGQMLLLYQLKVDMNSGETAGVEALLYWQHPTFGVQSQSEFAGLARQIGMEDLLNEWMLQAACEAGARWMARGLDFGRMSVNVTRHQLTAQRFVDKVEKVLVASGLPGTHLMLEIPDGALDSTGDGVRALVSELRTLGVALSLDDFGLGSASFLQLKHLPLAEIKVSSEFVKGLAREASDRAIVAAAIALGHHLDARVVAMGVDDTEQLFVLHELSCDMQQGSLFSPPQPEAEVVGLLRRAAG